MVGDARAPEEMGIPRNRPHNCLSGISSNFFGPSSFTLPDLGLRFGVCILRTGHSMSEKYSAEWWEKFRGCDLEQADVGSWTRLQSAVCMPTPGHPAQARRANNFGAARDVSNETSPVPGSRIKLKRASSLVARSS